MSVVMDGVAVVFGIKNSGHTFTGGLVSSGNEFQRFNFTRESEKLDVKDGNAETIGQVFWNKKKSISATVVPTGTSRTAAVACLLSMVGAPGAAVTVVSTDGSTTIGDIYNLLRSSLSQTPDGLAAVDVEMECFDDNEVTGTKT